MKHLLINCDLGEWEDPDTTARLMENIHLANIACGGHAGSKETIQYCDMLARNNGVLTGAHPGIMGNKGRSLPEGFTLEDFTHLLENQIQFFLDAGAYLHHIKLHGALYHLSETDADVRSVLLDYTASHETKLVCLAGGIVAKEAQERDIPVLQEAFLDRNYLPNGSLVPRDAEHATISDTEAVRERITKLEEQGALYDIEGHPLAITVDTLCIHSDSPNSLEIAGIAMQSIS